MDTPHGVVYVLTVRRLYGRGGACLLKIGIGRGGVSVGAERRSRRLARCQFSANSPLAKSSRARWPRVVWFLQVGAGRGPLLLAQTTSVCAVQRASCRPVVPRGGLAYCLCSRVRGPLVLVDVVRLCVGHCKEMTLPGLWSAQARGMVACALVLRVSISLGLPFDPLALP